MAGVTTAVQIADYGGPEAVFVGPRPRPEPGAGEVLVRAAAWGVNPIDWKIREGVRQATIPLVMPAVLGCDLCGVVEAAGPGVEGYAPGDLVFGMTGLHGAFAEHVAIGADKLAPKPAALTEVEAAAVPLAALTAWQGLALAGLGPGQSVLIHAGGGGVGAFAVQIARARGARVVATASAEKADYVLSLGAEQVIDYRAARFEEVAGDLDVVFDLIGGETQDRSWRLLKPGGVLISAVAVPPAGDHRPGGRRNARVGVRPVGADLKQIAALIDAGRLKVHVEATFPLAEAAAAIERVKQGRTRGKLVLTRG